jgi:hypothetical protein
MGGRKIFWGRTTQTELINRHRGERVWTKTLVSFFRTRERGERAWESCCSSCMQCHLICFFPLQTRQLSVSKNWKISEAMWCLWAPSSHYFPHMAITKPPREWIDKMKLQIHNVMNAGSFQCEVGRGNASGMTYLTSAASERKYPPKNFETCSSQDHLDNERDETVMQKHQSSTMRGRPNAWFRWSSPPCNPVYVRRVDP